MKCLVTGATGFIGSKLAERLAAEGNEVTCLVRSPEKFQLAGNVSIRMVRGDLHDTLMIDEALNGIDTVFHLAAYAKPWSKDPELPYRINVEGTANMLEGSVRNGVRTFILTSTAGVYGPSGIDRSIDETWSRSVPYPTGYECTKSEAETMALRYMSKGLRVVILNPSRVYGPGPENESNSVTRIIRLFSLGKWHIIPGDGSSTGNYVFIDDVVEGHLLAASKGKNGERYILGGDDLTFDELFRVLSELTVIEKRMIRIPLSLMLGVAKFLEFQSRITSIPPLITVPFVRKYNEHYRLSSLKAMDQLGYSPISFKEGVSKTLSWLKENVKKS